MFVASAAYHLDLHTDLQSLVKMLKDSKHLFLLLPIHFSIRYNSKEIKQAIEEVSREIADIDSYENVLSMLIVKNGKLVHEVYSPYCQRNTLHWMASITKTITSTLIGIAAAVTGKMHAIRTAKLADVGFHRRLRRRYSCIESLLPGVVRRSEFRAVPCPWRPHRGGAGNLVSAGLFEGTADPL